MKNLDILFVGNKKNHSVIEKAINDLPVTEHIASSKEEALEMLQEFPLALVLLDAQAKKTDHLKFAQIMQTDQRFTNLPIIFLTSDNKKQIEQICTSNTNFTDIIPMSTHTEAIKHKILTLLQLYIGKQTSLELQNALQRSYQSLQQEMATQHALEQKLATYITDMENTKSQIQQNNAEMSKFDEIISYDLKQPSKEMQNQINTLLKNNSSLKPAEKKKLEKMLSISEHITDTVSKFKEYSDIKNNDLVVKEFDINQLIKEITDRMQDTIKEQNVTINIPKKLPKVVYDKVRLREVFTNLIENAIKFNDKQDKTVDIGFSLIKQTEKPEYIFSVKDNGIGIAEEDHEAVFEMFHCLNEDKEQFNGTGVGLSFAQKILARRGGRIWIESIPNQFTKVSFTLHQSSRRHRLKSR